MRTQSRTGFTLIELLIVVVILGILASIAIPAFRNSTGRSFNATVKSDLRNLATAQESYFYDHGEYALNIALLDYTPSLNVSATIAEATAAGWSATMTHPQAIPATCALFFGNAAPLAPATAEGTLGCT